MPFYSEGRSLLRFAAVGGALVGTLATASSASAALAGAPAAAFSNRPNLQSVTFDNTFGIASFKFDRNLQNPAGATALNPNSFRIGGYAAGDANTPQQGAGGAGTAGNGTAISANISDNDNSVVQVTYVGVNFDATTFGAVADAAVRGTGTFSEPNIADATGTTGSITENGTRGHTVGPDLQSVIVNTSDNRIFYIFDEDLDDAANPAVANIGFYRANGTRANAAQTAITDTVVTGQFAAADDVNSAVQAVVNGGTGGPLSLDTQNPAPPFATVTVSGRNPLTVAPSLVSAEIEPSLSGAILYTFDQSVTAAAGNAGGFTAVLSNGATVAGTGTQVTGQGNTQVRVTFDTAQQQRIEHVVYGSVAAGTVTDSNTNTGNLASGKPAGGNAGARGTGFTSAPDVLSATINRNEGQVVVTFDGRLIGAGAAGFQLLDPQGNTIATTATSASFDQQARPTPTVVRLNFPRNQTAVASTLRVRGNRVEAGGFVQAGGGAGGQTAVQGTIAGGTFPTAAVTALDSFNVETLVVPTQVTTVFKK